MTVRARTSTMARLLADGLVAGGLLACGLASSAAVAQTDLTAGKSPAQVFSSDCSACHRSAQGLTRGRDPSSVARFLRDHYTSSPGHASALAGYLAGVGGAAPPPDRRGRQRPVEATPPDEERTAERPPSAGEPRPPAPLRQRQAPAPAPEGEVAAAAAPGSAASQAQPSKRTGGRLASAPLDRLRPYMAAHETAKPAAGEADDRLSRLQGYATSGTDIDALRQAALAGRPAPEPAVTKPAPAVPPETGSGAERPADRDPAREPRGAEAAAPPSRNGAGAPAADPPPAEPPVLSGPPVGSGAPTTQSNPDER